MLAVLADYSGGPIVGKKILDIGAGSGAISNHLASMPNEVLAADVENQTSCENPLFHFVKVQDETLPFEDGTFDIVISNHVIEHVQNQKLHLSEVYRVLKTDGVCYFATPNRYFIQDPHTQTVFLHYFPYDMFLWCLKRMGKYREDIRLLSWHQMQNSFRAAGFAGREYTIEILREPEKYHLEQKLPFKVPRTVRFFSPTNIFVLSKPAAPKIG